MKRFVLIVLFLGICGERAVATAPGPQEFSVGVSASFGDARIFHGPLSPYGEWLELDAGFYAWRPTHVHRGWRPYLHGRWAWTDYGWYWVSSEPFGWAVFHYGRWYDDDYYGWVWVPDHTWGPAWVEWRYNDDYIGWAPLPPYASFSINIGIRFTTHWFAPYHYWNFVRYRHITSPYVIQEVVPMEYTRRLIRTTRSVGRYEVEGDRVINRGVDRSIIERRGGFTRINRVDIRESSDVGERFVRDRSRERIEVYRPDRSSVSRSEERIEARRAERGTSLDLQRIERAPRETSKNPEPREIERERKVTREESRTPEERVQRPEAQRPQEETVQRRREERRLEVPQAPSAERREVERRREDRYPFPRREQAEQQRPQREERREILRERPQREERREIAPPRARIEQSRPKPEIRQESPRGSEQGRREGGRKRD